MPPRRAEPGSLASRMRAMRETARLGVNELADRLGWYREKVTRIQTGQRVPTRQDIADWATACGHPELADELLAMLPEAQATHRLWKDKLSQGPDASQRDWNTRIREARVIRNFEIVVIPGLCQTADYARHRVLDAMRNYGIELTEQGIDAAVAAKLQRQEILYNTAGRRFEFVMTEAALRIGAAPAPVMLGQLDRLAQLSQLPNITVGVIPFGVQIPAMPQNPFIVLDDEVSAETHGSEVIPTPDEAQTYINLADAMSAEALTGDEARRLITSAARWWSTLLAEPDA